MKIVAGEGKKERNFGRSGGPGKGLGKGGPVEGGPWNGLGEGGVLGRLVLGRGCPGFLWWRGPGDPNIGQTWTLSQN